MFGSSMLLTVGAALDRAKEDGTHVQVSVSGEWISGRVVNTDGHGVAFLESSGDICVFRPEAIAGVRMPNPGQEPAQQPSRRAPIEMHAVVGRPRRGLSRRTRQSVRCRPSRRRSPDAPRRWTPRR